MSADRVSDGTSLIERLRDYADPVIAPNEPAACSALMLRSADLLARLVGMKDLVRQFHCDLGQIGCGCDICDARNRLLTIIAEVEHKSTEHPKE